MVKLSSKLLIGRGLWRSCYLHPNERNKCIKVYHESVNSEMLKWEIRENKRVRKREHHLIIPQYFGEIPTNFGPGYVFQLIQDQKGRSITLEAWLKRKPYRGKEIKEKLYGELLKSAGVYDDLNCQNILVVEDGKSLQFAVVDGLVEKKRFKIRSAVPFFARQKCRRKWQLFEPELDRCIQASLLSG